MAKKLTSLLIAVVMMIMTAAMCTTAFADSYIGVIIDYNHGLETDEEESIRLLLNGTAKKMDMNIAVILVSNLTGMTPKQFAENEMGQIFGYDSDSMVMLLCDDDDGYDYIYCTGTAADRFHDKTNDIFDAFYSGLETGGFYAGIISFCGYFGVEDENAPEVSSEYTISLADYDDSIPYDKELELYSYMKQTAREISCHVGLVITDDMFGYNEEEYAIQFYKDCFGAGSDAVVLLLCNDHINYDYIYTYGKGTDLYDARVDDIFDDIYDAMGEDKNNYDYYAASKAFCDYLRGHTSLPHDYYDYEDDEDFYIHEEGSIDLTIFIAAPIIGAIITFIVIQSISGGYEKKKPISARHYMDQNAIKWIDRQDIYLRETNTSVRISSSSSGGGGRSRSGGGGRRRSGGGGGRGRRR